MSICLWVHGSVLCIYQCEFLFNYLCGSTLVIYFDNGSVKRSELRGESPFDLFKYSISDRSKGIHWWRSEKHIYFECPCLLHSTLTYIPIEIEQKYRYNDFFPLTRPRICKSGKRWVAASVSCYPLVHCSPLAIS